MFQIIWNIFNPFFFCLLILDLVRNEFKLYIDTENEKIFVILVAFYTYKYFITPVILNYSFFNSNFVRQIFYTILQVYFYYNFSYN